MPMISLLKAENEAAMTPLSAAELLRRLLLPFGGSEFFFAPGERVVFLADVSLPADNATGANFDTRLIWALLRLAQDEGVTDLTVALRPRESFTFEQILKNTDYGKLAQLPGIKVLGLDDAAATPRPTDTALALERAEIYDVLSSADMLVSLAKFKTAEGRLFGGALDNMAYAARELPETDYALRQRALVDIYSIMAPDLTIVDCLKGQSGFQNNKASCLLAGSDAVALDTVLCAMGDLDMTADEALLLATQYGMGVSEPGQIAMFGDDLREFMAETPKADPTLN